VTVKLVYVLEIIHVINFNFINLPYFEVILDLKRLNPHRVEVVHHNLSHAKFQPHILLFLEQDYHSVSTCKRI